MNEQNGEIWSEYIRIKNCLMDYDENLREAIGNARMILALGYDSRRVRLHYAKAQKHVGLIMDLAMSAGAIPQNADPDKIKKIEAVAKGDWSSIEDFERVQGYFRDWYRQTRFYDVTIAVDNRAAVVRKYGKG